MTAMQTACSAISYSGDKGRKTGSAISSFEEIFNSAPGGKKILFLLTTGKSDDDVATPAKKLVSKGISIFALGIGKDIKNSELKTISRYFLTTKWKGLLTSMVKIQNSLVKGKSGYMHRMLAFSCLNKPIFNLMIFFIAELPKNY